MRLGAIIQASIDIIGEIEQSGRPADRYLKDWGRANRYAGSGDRALIAETVFGVFRKRAALAWRMQSDDPRALVLAYQALEGGRGVEELASACDGKGHNAAPLSEDERAGLESAPDGTPSAAVTASFPAWLELRIDPRFDPVALMSAMNARAPVDLRVNRLLTDMAGLRTRIEQDLGQRASGVALDACRLSPVGLRVRETGARRAMPDFKGLKAFQDGDFEIQDEGSQLVSLLTGARPGERIVDLCAGAGGKTLAMASGMAHDGEILACDVSGRRLQDARTRLTRAGARIARIRTIEAWSPDGGTTDPDLEDWAGRADRVVLDVPCSGSGTWRRSPDAKWRLRPDWLDEVGRSQQAILARGVRLVRPGGLLVYITCSILAEENRDRIARFLEVQPAFSVVPVEDLWRAQIGPPPHGLSVCFQDGLLHLAPHLSGTDGFFFAALKRRE